MDSNDKGLVVAGMRRRFLQTRHENRIHGRSMMAVKRSTLP
jgi:hypothetical protein